MFKKDFFPHQFSDRSFGSQENKKGLWVILGRFLGSFWWFICSANFMLMEVKVHSSALKFVPSDVFWFVLGALQLAVLRSNGVMDTRVKRGSGTADKMWLKDW